MNQNDHKPSVAKPSGVKGGPLLEGLPRIVVSSGSAPSKKAASAADAAYGITSAKKLTEAFAVKRHLTNNA